MLTYIGQHFLVRIKEPRYRTTSLTVAYRPEYLQRAARPRPPSSRFNGRRSTVTWMRLIRRIRSIGQATTADHGVLCTGTVDLDAQRFKGIAYY
eukprot:1193656-Prorocentrum_minimum.AAC.2